MRAAFGAPAVLCAPPLIADIRRRVGVVGTPEERLGQLGGRKTQDNPQHRGEAR